jgi:N6-L-threonylcarbamoyladenine synthase
MPELIDKLEIDGTVSAVGFSSAPREVDGSYMPCFLAGRAVANTFAKARNIPVYSFSHQNGHIMAALYSADKLNMINDRFYAFHVSGGTTDIVLCKPCEGKIIKTIPVSSTSDLKAGQAVDRIGVKMGLRFPAGAELEKLALKSDKQFKNKIKLVDGKCSLSGLQNKCEKMLSEGETKEDVAKFLLTYIADTVISMTEYAKTQYGNIPVVYAGGVMSNSIIQRLISEKIQGSYFAEPQFSCDNAAGVAFLAYESLKR